MISKLIQTEFAAVAHVAEGPVVKGWTNIRKERKVPEVPNGISKGNHLRKRWARFRT